MVLSDRDKRIVWIGAIATVVVALLGARLLPILDYSEAHSAARKNHLLSIVPRPLSDTTVSPARGTTLSAFGYQYEVPWTNIEKTVQPDSISDVVFTSGEAVAFGDPGAASDLARLWRSSGADKFLGAEATRSNYQFGSTILSLTPQSFSIWMSSTEANRAITLFRMKEVYTTGAETGLYSIQTPRYQGFQKGDPKKTRTIELTIYDQQDREYHFLIGTAKDTPLMITQPEINRIVETLRPLQTVASAPSQH